MPLKLSQDAELKQQKIYNDNSNVLNLDQSQKHQSVLVRSQKDMVAVSQALSQEKSAICKHTWAVNAVMDRENQVKLAEIANQSKYVLSELVNTAEKEPEQLAKALIQVAIGFEKRHRMATAFSIFKKAY
ncbi:unnamed protein product [Peronospora belbahrii]|uniref:Uncharacterized protein n=1 Tax=Peronospora belbahrii TaxID=622444 RepID=A0AAU9KQW2_9STRA|nr:unnamed protein product [Peronospora belbahrii]